MIRDCGVCKRQYKIDTMGRDISDRVLPVCSLTCLKEYLKCLAKVKGNFEKICNPVLRPFQSAIEHALYSYLHTDFNILYEPYILKMNKTIYIPDFYIVDKNIFIEVKGGRHRITKFKKFAKHYPIYILLPEIVQEVE